MDVFWQVVRDGAPLLTLIVILVTLRGQRVINANAARDRFEQARNEARMVILRPKQPAMQTAPTTLVEARRVRLVLEIAGPSPIVKIESALVEKDGPNAEKVYPQTLKTEPVLKQEEVHVMWPLQDRPGGDKVEWRVQWEDRSGYAWEGRYSFADGPRETKLLSMPGGRSLIVEPTRRQKLRNLLLPYDAWAPSRKR
ncbi:hypothetical protein ACIGG9_15945 [Pseudonocardia alni]|uniref:hypothetical protein n=1 Tax=Pseudonocardia alni TaxID=33907 RepID=UPI0033FCFA61